MTDHDDTRQDGPIRELRAVGVPGRRRTDEALPREWSDAREHVQRRFSGYDDMHEETQAQVRALSNVAERLDHAAERIDLLALTVRDYVAEAPARATTRAKVQIMWGVLACVAVGVLGYGIKTWAPVFPTTTQDERLAAIADAMLDIPRGDASKRMTYGTRAGFPTVSAVQAELAGTTVRGVTAVERDAACLMVPEACRAP